MSRPILRLALPLTAMALLALLLATGWISPPAAAQSPEPSPQAQDAASTDGDDGDSSEQPAARGDAPPSGPITEEDLPERYRTWLAEVALLISEQERETFLTLREDYERDAFIERFWAMRDPDRKTPQNELRDRWRLLVAEAEEYGGADSRDERARILLLNGFPAARFGTRCAGTTWPIEVWYYRGSDQVNSEFLIIFYRPYGGGPFRIWYPGDGVDRLLDNWAPGRASLSDIAMGCPDGRRVAAAIASALRQNMDYSSLVSRAGTKQEDEDAEWVRTFGSYSTQLPPAADTFPAEIEVSYPGRRQSRTVVQGLVTVPLDAVGVAELAGSRSVNFIVNGEVVREGALFDSFRYKFDFPESQIRGATVPMVFERNLRPGQYRLLLRVEDLNGEAFHRAELDLEVPDVDRALPPAEPMDSETAQLLREANALLADGETTIKLLKPRGELLTDMVRFETLVAGDDIAEVVFELNGRPVLTDTTGPYSVELNLGTLPRTHTLSATAYDAEGVEQGQDEILVNAGGTRFRINLVEPRRGVTYRDSVRARATVEVPTGQTVERVEFFLDEERIATLYDEPWVQPILLPGDGQLAYVRAVAFLEDGNFTEDTAFVNAPDYLEEVDVQMVELYASVLDRSGRPIQGLTRADFRVLEEGEPQQIRRFEQVRDLPIHAATLLDISASMDEDLDRARRAGLAFFQQIIEPKDRAAVITFNDRPNLTVQFTNEIDDLAGGLAGLKAERGTALWDSLIFSLYYFNGVRGQRALLLLSDGKDESSRFAYEEALEYARRAGVTIYSVGLDLPRGGPRRNLREISEETGGRAWFIDTVDELEAIYAQIEQELRSQYLVTYQSSNAETDDDFRRVELEVPTRSGVEVKTMTGYYP